MDTAAAKSGEAANEGRSAVPKPAWASLSLPLPHFQTASRALAAKELNGQGLNGQELNGQGLNGQGLHGQGLNGQGLNGQGLNGQGLNGQGLNGQGLNGQGARGERHGSHDSFYRFERPPSSQAAPPMPLQ
jgi:hypothetical protein